MLGHQGHYCLSRINKLFGLSNNFASNKRFRSPDKAFNSVIASFGWEQEIFANNHMAFYTIGLTISCLPSATLSITVFSGSKFSAVLAVSAISNLVHTTNFA